MMAACVEREVVTTTSSSETAVEKQCKSVCSMSNLVNAQSFHLKIDVVNAADRIKANDAPPRLRQCNGGAQDESCIYQSKPFTNASFYTNRHCIPLSTTYGNQSIKSISPPTFAAAMASSSVTARSTIIPLSRSSARITPGSSPEDSGGVTHSPLSYWWEWASCYVSHVLIRFALCPIQ